MSLNNSKNIKLKIDTLINKDEDAAETNTESHQNDVIQIGSNIYLFPRLQYETNKSYFLRREFFIKIAPKSEKEYLNMSIIWGNIKILECSYPPEVIENINKMLISNS